MGLLVSAVGRLSVPVMTWAGLSWHDAGQPFAAVAVAAVCWLIIAPAARYFAFSSD
jgi:hypothetical protein